MDREPVVSPARRHAPQGLADILGLTAAINMLRRRMWLVTMFGLASATLTFAVIMLQPRVYTATSLLMLNPALAPASAAPQQMTALEAEIALLRSPALMNELAVALGMQSVDAEVPGLADDLSRTITINQRADTQIIEINARTGDAQRSQLFANTYADVYLASQVNMGANTALSENSWLSRRLAELREDARAKEDAAQAFRAQSGLGGPEEAAAPSQLEDLRGQLQGARNELAERESRLRQFQDLRSSGASFEAIASSFGSVAMNSLRDREADIARRQQDLENRYLPTHPAVQAIQAERRDLDSQIASEVQRISGNLEAEVTRARSRVQSLQAAVRESAPAPPSITSNADAAEQLQRLESEAQTARELYETFLERSQNSADQSQLNAPTAQLLSRAALPAEPSSPQLRFALLMMAAAGLLFGVGAGLIAELFDQSVKNADDLEAKVGVPAITSIPTISKRMMRQMPPAERHPSGYLVGRPMSAFTESLRVLRTVIVYSKLDLSSKVVAVTSALPDEGKTTISMCLARVAAMSGQRVCVVDCDLRKQSINDVIDIETDVGILQVLAGEAPWRSAIVRDPNSDAHVLPIAASGFTPRDVFGSEAMGNLIGELRAHYDLVILDCAPILAVAETRIVVGRADTTVLIARAGRTAIGAMRAAVMQTEAAGGNILGIALNYVRPRWQSFTDSLYFNESKSYYSVS
jgi:capsular exopolysaccharide synthesis family protein